MHYAWETPSDGVYRCRLPFLDVTVGLIRGSDSHLLIDCGTTLLEAQAIAEDVATITGGVVTHLVMTHDHFDHVLGSAWFGDAVHYGAPAVGEALTTGLDAVRTHAIGYGADPSELDRAIAAVRAPDHLLLHADLDLGDRLVHVRFPGPGHTDHDLVVVIPAVTPAQRTVVFCGDLVEESADPAINDESDVLAWPRALDEILRLGGSDAVYVPGHGALVDANFVRAQRDWLARRAASDAVS
ncbi:MBL fold metallo-hydrolase [Mycolicibacterium sp.]|uniref:MBL fold metallo-hydrolase n=1 Tax=Mycolicibacterium sp. TaxID=2320850 RepID=UPI001A1BA3D9|nr:MBL fold metallo-hydrolase [Mycolicibacterium sp.]MBJ7338180.1 MBL fold metallo-hydrolase [Mycolicibacterium sp.]